MRELINLLEAADPITGIISEASAKFGLETLFGGNCGMFALALAAKLQSMGIATEVMITCKDNFDDGIEQDISVTDIIMAETDIYHVFLSHNDHFYDGHGLVDRNEMADWIYTEYGDPSPVLFAYPFDSEHEQALSSLMRSETNWSIPKEAFDLFFSKHLSEAVAKSGARIEFDFHENIEDRNRGFVLHKLEARIFDHVVGYLKVDYVDDKEFKKENPEGFYSWQSNFGGATFPESGKTLDELTPQQVGYFTWSLAYNDTKFKNTEELRAWLKEWEKTPSAKRKFVEYKKFLKYHINKPKVAYINVRENTKAGILADFTRQGIGTALYCKMAHLMKAKGMKFYASTLQQPEAEAVWKKMRALGWTGKDTRGMFLDPSKCPEEYDATAENIAPE